MTGILITTGILLLFVIFMLYMIYRNNLVCRERTRIRKELHNLEMEYLESDRYEEHHSFLDTKMEKLEKYSYNKMLFQLFKFHWTLEDIGIVESPYNSL